jgi:hypothetical protein
VFALVVEDGEGVPGIGLAWEGEDVEQIVRELAGHRELAEVRTKRGRAGVVQRWSEVWRSQGRVKRWLASASCESRRLKSQDSRFGL